jgi:hypothetical protein
LTGGPVEGVVVALQDAGYARIDEPQSVGGIPFQFDAMLAGRDSLDLIAVVDLTLPASDQIIRRQIAGLAQALDLVRSRRSLTIILVGPRRGTSLVQAISGVARVLVVGPPGDPTQSDLTDALAVLLPLHVAPQDTSAAEPWAQVREQLLQDDPEEAGRLIRAATYGEDAVKDALAALLNEPLAALADIPPDEAIHGD